MQVPFLVKVDNIVTRINVELPQLESVLNKVAIQAVDNNITETDIVYYHNEPIKPKEKMPKEFFEMMSELSYENSIYNTVEILGQDLTTKSHGLESQFIFVTPLTKQVFTNRVLLS